MIKSDEHEILKFVRFFGPLKKEQVCLYFEGRFAGNVKRIITNMCIRKLLFYDDRSFILYPTWKKDIKTVSFRMIAAFWVFLRFKDDAEGVYPTEYPSQILFVKNDTEYEIAFIDVGEETVLSAILNEKNPGTVKYLIMVESMDQIEKIKVKNVAAFCTRKAGKVSFYKPQDMEDFNDEQSD